jgi:hypothetical protein
MMKSVSARSIVPLSAAVSMAILWVVFVLPVAGPVSLGLLGLLSLVIALWVFRGSRSDPSMAQVIRDVNAEPVLLPVSVVVPAKDVP